MVIAFMREHGIEKMFKLRYVVSKLEKRSSSTREKLELLNDSPEAEGIVRDLNCNPQQRSARDRGLER